MSALNIFDLQNANDRKYVRAFSNTDDFLAACRNDYHFLIAFHATNINEQEISSIKSIGLKLSSAEFLKQKALDRFVLATDSSETQERAKGIIENYFEDSTITKVEINLSLNRRELEGESYQYLLFGPETLLPLADMLKDELNISFRKRMVEHGKPCIVKCQVPVEKVSDYWLNQIFEYLVNGSPEASLVYRNEITAGQVIEVEQVKMPYDKHGFAYM